jgi:hypothetical protein
MEPESSLPYSQVPATSPYSEPAPSSPKTPFHFLKNSRNINLPSTSGSPQWSLFLRLPHQTLCNSTELQYIKGRHHGPAATSNVRDVESDQGRSHNIAGVDKA